MLVLAFGSTLRGPQFVTHDADRFARSESFVIKTAMRRIAAGQCHSHRMR